MRIGKTLLWAIHHGEKRLSRRGKKGMNLNLKRILGEKRGGVEDAVSSDFYKGYLNKRGQNSQGRTKRKVRQTRMLTSSRKGRGRFGREGATTGERTAAVGSNIGRRRRRRENRKGIPSPEKKREKRCLKGCS